MRVDAEQAEAIGHGPTLAACLRQAGPVPPLPRWALCSLPMAGTFSRIRDIFRSKANKALDKMEDPRDTLDLSYEKQLEQLQKVRRGVADVATARKRIELQAQGLQKQADKLQGQAKAALQQGNEDLAREALSRRAALGEQLAELKTQHDQISEQEQKLVADLPGAPDPGRAVPHPEGDAEGQLHGGRGPDQGGRGGVGHLGLHGQRRRHHAAGPGQDRQHAGAGRRHRRAAGLGRARRPEPRRSTTSRRSSTRCRPPSQVDNELAALKAELGTGGAAADATAALPAAEQGGTGGESA